MPIEQEACIPVTGESSSFPSSLDPEITTLSENQIMLIPENRFLKQGKELLIKYPEIFEAVQSQDNDYFIVSKRASFVDRDNGYTEETILISKNGIAFIYASRGLSQDNCLLSEKSLSLEDLQEIDYALYLEMKCKEKYKQVSLKSKSIVNPTDFKITIPKTGRSAMLGISFFLNDIFENRYTPATMERFRLDNLTDPWEDQYTPSVTRLKKELESLYTSH